jgi:glyoxylase-like metal-dependent hydrolase (beta-lactamase superfamily II)
MEGVPMKRLLILAGLVAAGALACAVGAPDEEATPQEAPAAAATPAEEMVVGVEQVRDNLYMLTGGGGNTGVFIGSEGVTVVDTKLAGWGQPILDAIGGLTDLPVTTIINTHTHFDHVSGNVAFGDDVEVVAHEVTASNMEAWRPVTGLNIDLPPNVFADSGGRGLATRTYSDALTLGEGDEQIDLHFFGRAHTGGDSWVVFPALGVMHGGDAFLGKNLPIVDANNGGSGVDYPETLTAVLDNIEVETIITGHSTLMTMDDLAEFRDFNQAVMDRVRDGKAGGQSPAAIVAAWELPERFAAYGVPEDRLAVNVELIWNELP